jgi:segregation and condensation protein A
MTQGFALQRSRTYFVQIPNYEGPLDLLLQLIEKAELDISRLSLALVTDQYLVRMKEIEEIAPEDISAFIVVAAKLLQIKSEALLPRQTERETGVEDVGNTLAQQLIIYKRFKDVANFLYFQEASGLRTYLRLGPIVKTESYVPDLTGISIADLLMAANAILSADAKTELAKVVSAPKITIREKISIIAHFLRINQSGTFLTILPKDPIRLDIVVTFLALLELVKRKMVNTHQELLFGDIIIEPSENWSENLEFELEFGE